MEYSKELTRTVAPIVSEDSVITENYASRIGMLHEALDRITRKRKEEAQQGVFKK